MKLWVGVFIPHLFNIFHYFNLMRPFLIHSFQCQISYVNCNILSSFR